MPLAKRRKEKSLKVFEKWQSLFIFSKKCFAIDVPLLPTTQHWLWQCRVSRRSFLAPAGVVQW